MGDQTGPLNPNWRGGRSITAHKYVLLRMPGHHLADVRGYVYEHRLVAEQKLGRRLSPGEMAHHINEITTDNRSENIEIVNHAEHRKLHRVRERGLRDPGEGNPRVSCECGCGSTFRKYDTSGRPRRFVWGHNNHGGQSLG